MWFINNSYEIIWDYSDWFNLDTQLAPARKNGKIWFINKVGEVKIDFIYDNYSNWSEMGPGVSMAYIVKNEKCWLITNWGDILVDAIYDNQFLVNEALKEKYNI